SRVRAGQPLGVQQLRISAAGCGGRAGQREELLRLCEGKCLRSRGDDVDRFAGGRRKRPGTLDWIHLVWRRRRSREHGYSSLSRNIAGGGYSTVEDLQRFAGALMNHKLLNAEYTDLLTTGKVATPRGGKYAFGFFD